MWMDIHVMVFVGFGFLMVFLKTHCWASVGFTYLIGAWTIQCTILFYGFWKQVILHGHVEKINLDMELLINGDFGAAACLITMGGVLGKISFPQLFILTTIETIFYTLNIAISIDKLGAVDDVGGAITIHMFGAFYGIVATYFFQPKKGIEDKFQQGKGDHKSNLIAMIGTLFLFLYWPSFNAVLAQGMARQRALVNTFLSISGSTLVAVYVSRAWLGRIDMEVMLNATLAGGVVMGAACDLITGPGFAMLTGAIAGAISAFGLLKLNSVLKEKIGLHDTCGITFLHGIPGTLGGFVSAICAAAVPYNFGPKIQQELTLQHITVGPRQQAGYQLAAMGITIGIAITSGLLGGFIASRLPNPERIHDDAGHFHEVEYGDDTAKFNIGHHPTKEIELSDQKAN